MLGVVMAAHHWIFALTMPMYRDLMPTKWCSMFFARTTAKISGASYAIRLVSKVDARANLSTTAARIVNVTDGSIIKRNTMRYSKGGSHPEPVPDSFSLYRYTMLFLASN